MTRLRKVLVELKKQETEQEIRKYDSQLSNLIQDARTYFSAVSIERRGLSASGNSHLILKRFATLHTSPKLETKARRLLAIFYALNEEPLIFTKDITQKEQEQKKRRKDSAYIILNTLENKLRLLIATELDKITKEWWKQRIPDDVRNNAEDRKARNDNPWPWHANDDPLISYLDFNDYVKVITKRDNWRDVFQKVFVDSELTSAKLRELDPIRKKIAHNRDLSEIDNARLELHANDLLTAISHFRT